MVRVRHWSLSGKGSHMMRWVRGRHHIHKLMHCCSIYISPLYTAIVGNTRSVLGGCSIGGLGGLVWPWSAVGPRLPSTRMWIFML